MVAPYMARLPPRIGDIISSVLRVGDRLYPQSKYKWMCDTGIKWANLAFACDAIQAYIKNWPRLRSLL